MPNNTGAGKIGRRIPAALLGGRTRLDANSNGDLAATGCTAFHVAQFTFAPWFDERRADRDGHRRPVDAVTTPSVPSWQVPPEWRHAVCRHSQVEDLRLGGGGSGARAATSPLAGRPANNRAPSPLAVTIPSPSNSPRRTRSSISTARPQRWALRIWQVRSKTSIKPFI